MQQIYYACEWRQTKENEFRLAKASIETPTLGYTPLLGGFQLRMFEIQYWCYMVNAVLILFWAVALTKGIYNIRIRRLDAWQKGISIGSKVFAFVVPAALYGVSFTPAVEASEAAWIALNDIWLIGSLGLGSICMIAILIRYVQSRQLLSTFQGSSRDASATTLSGPRCPTAIPTAAKIQVDTMLLVRFGIAFVVLSAFEVSLLLLQFLRQHSARMTAARDGPDFSVRCAVSEIVRCIPGVTASLLAFVLFGTTAHFRQRYADFFKLVRRRRRDRSLPETDGTGSMWDHLHSTSQTALASYQCTVRAGEGDAGNLDLHDTKGVRKVDTTSVVIDSRPIDGHAQSHAEATTFPPGIYFGWGSRSVESSGDRLTHLTC